MKPLILSKNELHFTLKGNNSYDRCVLRVWKDRLNALVNPDDMIVIYMRLCSGDFSVPFTKETLHYVAKNPHLNSLLRLGSFTFPLKNEKKILIILSKLNLK